MAAAVEVQEQKKVSVEGQSVSSPDILLLDGLGMAGDWYGESLVGKGSVFTGVSANDSVAARWAQFNVTRVDAGFVPGKESEGGEFGKTAESGGTFSGGEEFKAELLSGKYTSCVVCDLSWDVAMHWFEKYLGETVQKFVRGGGLMVFPTSEGLSLMRLLAKLFEVPWTGSGYYRSATVGARYDDDDDDKDGDARRECAPPLLSSCFPGFALTRRYNAKVCALRNVPPEDRVLVVTEGSRHESLSTPPPPPPPPPPPAAAAEEGSGGGGGGDRDDRDDRDVAVATRKVGKGRVCYVGDVNCEADTAELVAAFCAAPSGFSANDLQALAALSPDEFSQVLQLKAKGNACFGAKDFSGAKKAYGRARKVFGCRRGSSGAKGEQQQQLQREEYLKVSSNLAEALLRLNMPERALATADDVLDLDPSNAKARYRKAKALVAMAAFTAALTELAALEAAAPDIAATKPFKALVRTAKAKGKEARQAAGAGLRKAFGAGGDGLGDVSTPPPPPGIGSCWVDKAAWGKGLTPVKRCVRACVRARAS
jgi:hypothetical protein